MKKALLLIFILFILVSCSENKMVGEKEILYNNIKIEEKENFIKDDIVEKKEVYINENIEDKLVENFSGEKENKLGYNKNIEKVGVVTHKKINKFLGEEYLILDESKLYCIFGDENNPEPNIGTLYSKKNIDNIYNPNLLERINYTYFKDDRFVYSHESICTTGMPSSCDCYFDIEDYDLNTFKDLGSFYFGDKNGIYHFGDKLGGVEINSFEVKYGNYNGKEYDAKDKNNYFNGGILIHFK